MHTLEISCEHRLDDSRRGLSESANWHHLFLSRIDQETLANDKNNSQDLHTFVILSTHLLSNIVRGLHASSSQH